VVVAREGDPDLIEKIADERNVTSVEELLVWLEEHNHPPGHGSNVLMSIW